VRQPVALCGLCFGDGCAYLLTILLCLAATADPAFEVVSVRLSGPQSVVALTGGPGTSDPEHIRYGRVRLNRLIDIAYGLQFDQISGPAWIETEEYDIVANVRPGATKEQVKAMWRNLLAERFHLATHSVTKDFPVYELTVSKNGSKLTPAAPGPDPPPFSTDQQSPRDTPNDRHGFPILPPGKRFGMALEPGIIRLSFRAFSIAELADRLGWPLGTMGKSWMVVGRIVDKTGLTGRYDGTLEFSGVWGPGGAFRPPQPNVEADLAPDLFHAMERQLGLRLEAGKMAMEVLVVDHAERTPAEN
jgi:uncharacterized protein (TIGR03435 family)